MFEHGIMEVAGGNEPLGQKRHFALLLFNNGIENIGHKFKNN